jgi:hypothetical protein
MSYYRGDYYRGDPFIGGLIGGAAKALGVGKLVSKAAGWVGKQITGSSVKKAVVGTTVAAAAPILISGLPTSAPSAPAPIQLGPIGINPGNMFPGGAPGITWGTRKRRRMNVLNPRALKRALRRAEGFEKIAQRTVNALHRGPKKFKSTKRRG